MEFVSNLSVMYKYYASSLYETYMYLCVEMDSLLDPVIDSSHRSYFAAVEHRALEVVVVLRTTAGWRKAPALAQRVCTRWLASPSSISLKNTMNTKDLEWFGPLERNTLRPLCCIA